MKDYLIDTHAHIDMELGVNEGVNEGVNKETCKVTTLQDALTKLTTTITTHTSQGKREIRIGGRIDRLDEVTAEDGQRILRVVDYKTGRVNPEDLDFGKTGEIPQIGLQLYLYKRLLSPDYPGADITGAIYQPAAIIAGEGVIAHSLDQDFCSRMDSGLDSVLDEICDLSVPWQRTDKRDKCAMCDFRAICGR